MDTPQTIDPRIVERIRKNLNLSRDGGATEAEAALAAEMAQKLMRKYNLSLAEVEAAGGAGEAGSKRTKHAHMGKAQYEFQQQLMLACAETNFCLVMLNTASVRGRRRVTGFTLIGREANVISARELYEYLNATTERLAFEYVGQDNSQRLSRAAVSFKVGCSERLGLRLRERHREALAQQEREARARSTGTPGTALVVSLTHFAQDEMDRNNDLRWGWKEGTTAAQRRSQEAQGRLWEAAVTSLRGTASTDRAELFTKVVVDTAHIEGVGEERRRQILQQAVQARLDELEREAERASETPAQKRKREEAEEKANKRWWERYERAQRAKEARTDHRAYSAGARAAQDVGLDKQVDEGKVTNNPRLS